MTDCPKNLEPGQYWIGKTAIGEDLILDLKKGDFSLGIFSLAGGGKGNSIMAVASSFLNTWIQTTGSHFYRVLILDAKGTDFHGLIKNIQIHESTTEHPNQQRFQRRTNPNQGTI